MNAEHTLVGYESSLLPRLVQENYECQFLHPQNEANKIEPMIQWINTSKATGHIPRIHLALGCF